MYDAPNILVCQQDPFNYTAINQQGYEYYKDFMTGTLELNKSVVTWAGRDNLTYSQIIDKIYRSVDIDKIKIYFDWYKGSTPSSVASKSSSFSKASDSRTSRSSVLILPLFSSWIIRAPAPATAP